MSEFYEGLAEILEVDASEINPDFPLEDNWDSLAVVSTIALIDEVYDVTVHPERLGECTSVGAIEQLIAAERQG